LKLSIENCGQTGTDVNMVTIDSVLSNVTIADPLRLTV